MEPWKAVPFAGGEGGGVTLYSLSLDVYIRPHAGSRGGEGGGGCRIQPHTVVKQRAGGVGHLR